MTPFDNVKFGFDSSECCPVFRYEEPHGIKIAVLPRFTFAAEHPDTALPLCMTIKFDRLYLSRFESAYEAVKVVLVDDERGETFGGGVWQDRHYVRSRSNHISPSELKVRVGIEYNTVNLLEHFPLPRRRATYTIYALLEEHKSNVVTLEVDVK